MTFGAGEHTLSVLTQSFRSRVILSAHHDAIAETLSDYL